MVMAQTGKQCVVGSVAEFNNMVVHLSRFESGYGEKVIGSTTQYSAYSAPYQIQNALNNFIIIFGKKYRSNFSTYR